MGISHPPKAGEAVELGIYSIFAVSFLRKTIACTASCLKTRAVQYLSRPRLCYDGTSRQKQPDNPTQVNHYM